MRKVFVVAVREYLAAVKTKAFIVSLVMMPLLSGGSIMVQAYLLDKVDVSKKRVAVIDYSGILFDSLVEASAERSAKDLIDPVTGKKTKPEFVFEKIESAGKDPDKIKLELSDRIRQNTPGDIIAFLVIDGDILDKLADPANPAINYYSNSPTYDDVQKWVAKPLNDRIRALRLKESNLDPQAVGKILASARVSNLGLVSVDEAGNIKKAQETNELANVLVPLGLMMLMLMVIMLGSTPLMHSVLEEKNLRIAEVLLGSVKPFQLMMGKLIGMVGVSLTVATVYLIGAYITINKVGYASYFPTHLVWWFVLYLALAVLMYGSIFIAVGASVSDMKESQSLVTPVMLVAFAPMFVWMNIVKEPNSALSTALSFFPTATPMLMIVRQSVPPGIPGWQPVVGAIVVLLTTTACVFAAGRIFRVGILIQGKGAKISDMIRWLIRG